MDDYESLSHTKWECKYHVVFHSQVPKRPKLAPDGQGVWGKVKLPRFPGHPIF
jgi:hypothetical protein